MRSRICSVVVLLVFLTGCAGMGLGTERASSLDLRGQTEPATIKLTIGERLSLLVPTPDGNYELGGAGFDSTLLDLEGFLYSEEVKPDGRPAYAVYTFRAVTEGKTDVHITARSTADGKTQKWRSVLVTIE